MAPSLELQPDLDGRLSFDVWLRAGLYNADNIRSGRAEASCYPISATLVDGGTHSFVPNRTKVHPLWHVHVRVKRVLGYEFGTYMSILNIPETPKQNHYREAR
jgi:hypothetical protein